MHSDGHQKIYRHILVYYCWPHLCLSITHLEITAFSNRIGQNKYEAK